jgi:hypothetical protein
MTAGNLGRVNGGSHRVEPGLRAGCFSPHDDTFVSFAAFARNPCLVVALEDRI